MPKVITGSKDQKKVQVLRGQSDIRQLRCQRCKGGITMAVPDGKGGTKQKCTLCEAEFISVSMD